MKYFWVQNGTILLDSKYTGTLYDCNHYLKQECLPIKRKLQGIRTLSLIELATCIMQMCRPLLLIELAKVLVEGHIWKTLDKVIIPVAVKAWIHIILTDTFPLWWNWSQSLITKAPGFRPNTWTIPNTQKVRLKIVDNALDNWHFVFVSCNFSRTKFVWPGIWP